MQRSAQECVMKGLRNQGCLQKGKGPVKGIRGRSLAPLFSDLLIPKGFKSGVFSTADSEGVRRVWGVSEEWNRGGFLVVERREHGKW